MRGRHKSKHTHGEYAVGAFMLCVAAVLLGLFGGGGSSHSKPDVSTPAQVVVAAAAFAVIDGDTLTWKDHPNLRLLGIAVPSVKHCYGAAAQQQLANLVGSKGTLTVVYDPTVKTYRKDLVFAYLDHGSDDIGLQLVTGGYARAYFANDERGQRAPQILKAQVAAQRAHSGLWGSCVARTGRR